MDMIRRQSTIYNEIGRIEISYSMDKSDNLFSLHDTSRWLFLLVNALYLVVDVCWFVCKFFLWFLKTHELLLVFSALVFHLFLMRIDLFWWRKQSLKPLFNYFFTNLFGVRYHFTSLRVGFLSTCNFPIKSFDMFLTGKSMEKIFTARKPSKLFEWHISRVSFLCSFQIRYLLKSNGDYFLWMSAKYAQIGWQE